MEPEKFPAPTSPRGSVLTASRMSKPGSQSDAQALLEALGGDGSPGHQPPLSSWDEARRLQAVSWSQQHLGRCVWMRLGGMGSWLSSALALISGSWSPLPPGGKMLGPRCWKSPSFQLALPSSTGFLCSLTSQPPALPSEKSLLQFSQLPVLPPPRRMCCY